MEAALAWATPVLSERLNIDFASTKYKHALVLAIVEVGDGYFIPTAKDIRTQLIHTLWTCRVESRCFKYIIEHDPQRSVKERIESAMNYERKEDQLRARCFPLNRIGMNE